MRNGGMRNCSRVRQVPHSAARVLRLAHFLRLRFAIVQRVRINVGCPNRWGEAETCNHNDETESAHYPAGHLGSIP